MYVALSQRIYCVYVFDMQTQMYLVPVIATHFYSKKHFKIS